MLMKGLDSLVKGEVHVIPEVTWTQTVYTSNQRRKNATTGQHTSPKCSACFDSQPERAF
jgi:hypothetical protein